MPIKPKCPYCKATVWTQWVDDKRVHARCNSVLRCGARGPFRKAEEGAIKAFCEAKKGRETDGDNRSINT